MLLAAAALSDPLGMMVHALRPGVMVATDGAHCTGSPASLGSNVGQGPARATTVVDLWSVRVANQPMGWIAKTGGGTFWYQDPDGQYYEQITAVNAAELRAPSVSIGGCFRSDLAL